MVFLCHKILFGNTLTLNELQAKEKGLFQETQINSLKKNEDNKKLFVNLSKVLGKITSIIHFPTGQIESNKTLLEYIYSFDNSSPQNQFVEFFNQFFRVKLKN